MTDPTDHPTPDIGSDPVRRRHAGGHPSPPSPVAVPRRRRLWTPLAAVAAVALAASACGSDGTAGADGAFSLVALLDELPADLASSDDMVVVAAADFEAASVAGGLERPAPGTDPTADEARDWLNQLTGVPAGGSQTAPPVAVLIPEAASPQQLLRHDEFVDEVGWSLLDVDQFVEYQVPPNVFTVVQGDIDPDALESAMGPAEGDIWRLGPEEDFAIDATETSPTRPFGQALRLAHDGDRLAIARSTPLIEAWLDDGDTLADHALLPAVARKLDAAGVYAAMLAAGEDISLPAGAARSPAASDDELVLDPFPAIGVGLGHSDGTTTVTVVYHFADADTAATNASRVEARVQEGRSSLTTRPLAETFSLGSVETDGPLVIAQLLLDPDTPPMNVWHMVHTRDALFTIG